MTFQAVLALLFSSTFFADAKVNRSPIKTFECPAMIAPNIERNSSPWIMILSTNNTHSTGTLLNVAVYDGHPKEMASLVPDIDQEPSQPSTWELNSASHRYWLACVYKGTDAKYALNLPAGLSQCSSFDGSGKGGFKCIYAGKKK